MSRIFTTSFASVYPHYVAFATARINPNVSSITGTMCGIRVEDIDDPLMQKTRYLDTLVDELAKGKPMDKVLRTQRLQEPPHEDP